MFITDLSDNYTKLCDYNYKTVRLSIKLDTFKVTIMQ